jgi:hypothetical protein
MSVEMSTLLFYIFYIIMKYRCKWLTIPSHIYLSYYWRPYCDFIIEDPIVTEI